MSAVCDAHASAGSSKSGGDFAEQGVEVSGDEASTFPRMGVSLLCLRSIARKIKRTLGEEVKTHQVCEQFVLPETRRAKSSFTEMLWAKHADVKLKRDPTRYKRPRVLTDVMGEATVFVSHAWSQNFLHLVEAVSSYVKEKKNDPTHEKFKDYFWIDIFSVNQHAAEQNPDPQHWADTFGAAVREIGCCCLVMSPWDRPKVFSRAWCLFEILSAIRGECKIFMSRPSAEESDFANALAANPRHGVSTFVSIDMGKAEATVEEDKKRIFSWVESSIGFDMMNDLIRKHLLGQYLGTLMGLRVTSMWEKATSARSLQNAHQVISDIIGHGAELRLRCPVVHAGKKWYASCLCMAARIGDLKTVKLVLGHGNESINLGDQDERCPLHWACAGFRQYIHDNDTHAAGSARYGRWVDILVELLVAGADISLGDKRGNIAFANLDMNSKALKHVIARWLERQPAPEQLNTEVVSILKAFSSNSQQKRLVRALLPALAQQALASGIEVGNGSKEVSAQRLKVIKFVRGRNGANISAFVKEARFSMVMGSSETRRVSGENMHRVHAPPYARECIVWGTYVSKVTIIWRHDTGLRRRFQAHLPLVWHEPLNPASVDEQLADYDESDFDISINDEVWPLDATQYTTMGCETFRLFGVTSKGCATAFDRQDSRPVLPPVVLNGAAKLGPGVHLSVNGELSTYRSCFFDMLGATFEEQSCGVRLSVEVSKESASTLVAVLPLSASADAAKDFTKMRLLHASVNSGLRGAEACPVGSLERASFRWTRYQDRSAARVAVAVAIEDVTGKICLTRRAAHMRSFAGAWVLPGGGVEGGENFLDAGIREVREEIGLNLDGTNVTLLPLLWESCFPNRIEEASDAGGIQGRYLIAFLLCKLPHSSEDNDAMLDTDEVDAVLWVDPTDLWKHITGAKAILDSPRVIPDGAEFSLEEIRGIYPNARNSGVGEGHLPVIQYMANSENSAPGRHK